MHGAYNVKERLQFYESCRVNVFNVCHYFLKENVATNKYEGF
jgi:hypothetical protein